MRNWGRCPNHPWRGITNFSQHLDTSVTVYWVHMSSIIKGQVVGGRSGIRIARPSWTAAISDTLGIFVIFDVGWWWISAGLDHRKELQRGGRIGTGGGIGRDPRASGATVSCATTGVAGWVTETYFAITNANNNMLKGCLYAQANCFTTGGRVNVVMQFEARCCSHGIGRQRFPIGWWWKSSSGSPQLFSAAMGDAYARRWPPAPRHASARAQWLLVFTMKLENGPTFPKRSAAKRCGVFSTPTTAMPLT